MLNDPVCGRQSMEGDPVQLGRPHRGEDIVGPTENDVLRAVLTECERRDHTDR